MQLKGQKRKRQKPKVFKQETEHTTEKLTLYIGNSQSF